MESSIQGLRLILTKINGENLIDDDLYLEINSNVTKVSLNVKEVIKY